MREDEKDWERFAQDAPYHAVITNGAYTPDQLTEARLNEFFASGVENVGGILGGIKGTIGRDFAPTRALDFGCGVGRLTLALADHCQTVFGVDAAPSMLREAARNRDARRPGADIRFSLQIPDEPVDFIFSYLVFQHIRPARGFELLKQLLSRLQLGGIVAIQFVAYRTEVHLRSAFAEAAYLRFDGVELRIIETKELDSPVMSMFDYDMTQVLAIYAAADVETLWVQHADFGGHHGFWVCGRRGPG